MTREQQLQSVLPIIAKTIRSTYPNIRIPFEDLYQDALMVIYDKLNNYSEERGKLTTYVVMVLKTTFRLYLTSKYRFLSYEIKNDDLDISILEDDRENPYEKYYNMLEIIISKYSYIFTKNELLYLSLVLNKKNAEEIENIMNISYTNRAVVACSCKKKIKELIKNYDI